MTALMSNERFAPHVARTAEARVAASTTTAHNDTASSLLRLPGELLNLIYELVFTSAPYQMTIVFDKETGDDLGVQIKHRPLGMDLTRVCRKLHQDTALLPFVLNEIRCLDIKVLGRLHDLLLPEQRKAIRKLTIDIKIDEYCSIDDFLIYAYRHRVLLSNSYEQLEQAVIVAESTDYSSSWQGTWPSMNAARARIIQDNKLGLEAWLRKGAKEGFEVVFEDVLTKYGAWE